jgi:hypothetical protein
VKSYAAAISLLVALVTPAGAGTITLYTGADDGAPTSGPFPNSSAAETNFLIAASALGNVNTHSFNEQPLGALTVSFDDGTPQSLIFTGNLSGGAQFFGFTDTARFSTITISNSSASDHWGIDGVSFNRLDAVDSVPGPVVGAGLPGLVAGCAGLLW